MFLIINYFIPVEVCLQNKYLGGEFLDHRVYTSKILIDVTILPSMKVVKIYAPASSLYASFPTRELICYSCASAILF